MTDRRGPVTISDVALRAGVSTATVSRVLAGIGNPQARDRRRAVMAAVDELDYRPSGVARSLRMRRTRTLGPHRHRHPEPVLPGARPGGGRRGPRARLLDPARQRGLRRAPGDALPRPDGRPPRRRHDHRVEPAVAGELAAGCAASPVPVVVVNAEPAGLPVTVITERQRRRHASSRSATSSGSGIAGSRTSGARRRSRRTAARVEGFRRACAEAGLDPSDTPIVEGDGLFEGGVRGGRDARGAGRRT